MSELLPLQFKSFPGFLYKRKRNTLALSFAEHIISRRTTNIESKNAAQMHCEVVEACEIHSKLIEPEPVIRISESVALGTTGATTRWMDIRT